MNKFRILLAASVAGMAFTPFLASPAYAQETTSSIRGTVTGDGAPIANATVTITHVPSGTVSTVTTNAEGGFSASGLRVGGPFSVKVAAPGFNNFEATDVFTQVGQAYAVPIALESEGETIVITASKIRGAGTISQGPAKVLTAEDIANVSSINRDIRDLSRRDPFARLDDTPGGGRAVSFAGQNARFNRFSVDGVPITDNFGLNPDGLPSRRSPIPLDAIGQYQTKVAPFDIREGNFTGGAINIILRSGSNEFQGTGFYSYSDNHLIGKQTKNQLVTIPTFSSKDYGAELSGPIIPDKLFFMVAAERIRAGTPIPEGPIDNNAGIAIPTLTQAQVDNIASIAKSKYNYTTGGVLNNSDDSDDRIVAKIDANISETQRASVTYSYTKDSIKFNQNAFTTGTPGLGLESNGYIATNKLQTGVVQLNSDWSDKISSEVRVFYKDYVRGQDPILGRGFAQMQICTAPTSDRTLAGAAASASTSCAAGFAQVSIGPDVSRQSNALTSNTWGAQGILSLKAGQHNFRALFDYQQTSIFNQFLQRSAGDYYFDSIADFQAGNAQRLRYQNAVPSLNPDAAAANFGYQAYVFGLQDNWSISPTFNATIGVRYDMYGGQSRITNNPSFVSRYGFSNGYFIDGKSILQPRIGFDWKPASRLSVRGGVGIFAGGSPDVYISNSFSNTGILTNSVDIRLNNNGTFTGANDPATGTAALFGVTGTSIPALVNTQLAGTTFSTTAPSTTNALDPNFRLPSQWRATVSADYRANLGILGDGWNFGADLFYSKVRNQVLFVDLRVKPIVGSLTPDGRPRYASVTSFADTNSDLFLTDTDKGRAYIGVLRLDKSWDFGLTGSWSFTYQDVKDQAPATSSTASSNYANGAFFDPNVVQFGTANDQVKYFFKYGLTFNHAFFGDYKSTIAMFGETRIGHPYSFTFLDPASGRSPIFGTIGSGSRYLLYVPKTGTDALVSYDSAATQTAFESYMQQFGLTKYQGSVAPRNAFHSPWFTRVDLHLAQEIPTFVGRSRITLFADIDNFTNLINKKWGQVAEYAFPYNVAPVRVQCLTAPVATGTAPTTAQIVSNTSQACVQYRYSAAITSGGQFSAPQSTVYANQSLYAIRIGARFSF